MQFTLVRIPNKQFSFSSDSFLTRLFECVMYIGRKLKLQSQLQKISPKCKRETQRIWVRVKHVIV